MNLSGDFLWLWCGRIIFTNTFLIIFSDLNPQPFWSFLALIIFNISLCVFLFLRYKSFSVDFSADCLLIKSGVFFSKTLQIKYSSICSVRTLSTPLARKLQLQNPVLYCEGVTFFLPPLHRSFADIVYTYMDTKEDTSL